MPEVDMRCDMDPRRLFGRVKTGEDPPPQLVEGNLIEFSCRECRKRIGPNEAGELPTGVFHRFNVLGELVETEVSWE